MPLNQSYLAFIRTEKDRSQNLFIGKVQIDAPFVSLRTIGRIGSVPGDGREVYTSLSASPSNFCFVASSHFMDVPGRVFDWNNNIYQAPWTERPVRPLTAYHTGFVNELALAQLNKSNTHSPRYDAYIAERLESDPGFDTGTEDFGALLDGPMGFSFPAQLPIWSRSDTFVLGYTVAVQTRRGVFLGPETFYMEFDVRGGVVSFDAAGFTPPARASSRFSIFNRLITYNFHPVRDFSPPHGEVVADMVAGYSPLL